MQEGRKKGQEFDAVVMLIKSDWSTILADSQYDFVFHFAKHTKVIFVQPDQYEEHSYFKNTEFENIIVLHLPREYTQEQGRILANALLGFGICKPLLWLENVHFTYFFEASPSFLRIFYVAKDYFLLEKKEMNILMPYIVRCLRCTDVIAACSREVIENYNRLGLQSYPSIVLKSGTDDEFEHLIEVIRNVPFRPAKAKRKKVNILYDEHSMHVFTIKNYLEMFERYSHHEITYTPATGTIKCKPNALKCYDAVIIFYSIRVCVPGHLSSDFEKALQRYRGHKILMIQDDYDNTEETRRTIERLGIQTVYTVVPKVYIDKIYSPVRFPDVNFFNIMTGYISDEMKNYPNRIPISERKISIGYRGRDIGYWYGNLAREKLEIGIRMKKVCQERGLCVDIEWESEKRIYKEDWLKWLASCKATLGTESGSNIFDENGELRRIVEKEQEKNPGVSYEVIFDKYLRPYEGIIKMNQISPKMFEAISLKVALILYEGEYSGILKPDVHYISLKKDFSNVEEVIEKLGDNVYLQNLVDSAYESIMSDYRLSYQWLIEYMDACIDATSLLIRSRDRKIKLNNKVVEYFELFRRAVLYKRICKEYRKNQKSTVFAGHDTK